MRSSLDRFRMSFELNIWNSEKCFSKRLASSHSRTRAASTFAGSGWFANGLAAGPPNTIGLFIALNGDAHEDEQKLIMFARLLFSWPHCRPLFELLSLLSMFVGLPLPFTIGFRPLANTLLLQSSSGLPYCNALPFSFWLSLFEFSFGESAGGSQLDDRS